MSFPNDYPGVEDVKAWLRPNSQQALASGDDAILANLIQSAIAYIEGPEGAGRRFLTSADTTRRFDAARDITRDSRTLWLDEDLCQITSVTNGDGTTVSASAYVTNPRNETPWYALTLKLNSSDVWLYDDSPEDAIVIVGRWGYSLTPPADIAQACLDLVTYEYRRRSQSGSDDRPITTASGMVITPSSVPRLIRTVVESYRRLS